MLRRSGMRRTLAAAALSLGCASHSHHAQAADPVLMFVLGFAKNLIESSLKSGATKNDAPASVAPPSKSASAMSDADLRVVIEESFSYLTPAQRSELIAGLDKALSDPANSAYREAIITQFLGVARQVRFTHAQLDRLSADQKRALADQFAANFRTLSTDQQQALLGQLRQRALPLPADLNDMMLATLAQQR